MKQFNLRWDPDQVVLLDEMVEKLNDGKPAHGSREWSRNKLLSWLFVQFCRRETAEKENP